MLLHNNYKLALLLLVLASASIALETRATDSAATFSPVKLLFKQQDFILSDIRKFKSKLSAEIKTSSNTGEMSIIYQTFSSSALANSEFLFMSKTIAVGIRESPFRVGDQVVWSSYGDKGGILVLAGSTVFSVRASTKEVSVNEIEKLARLLASEGNPFATMNITP